MALFSRAVLTCGLILATAVPSLASSHPRRGPTSPKSSNKHSKTKSSGQHSIDDDRATQIQASLVKSGYMTNQDASGHWDTQTQTAMQKFQSDNGWQTKLIPDSRAIIKLGLGPAQDTAAGTQTLTAHQAASPILTQ